MKEEKIIRMGNSISVNELAENLNIPVVALIQELFKNGIVATINQKLDYDTAVIILEELKYKAKIKQIINEKKPNLKHELSDDAESRPVVVAVMGHVDHGKTTLLDNILKTKTVDVEAGGITQHISAYQTEFKGKKITLLDTPGHKAFAAVRQHGALLTDLVVLVVAVDDGVKPQTVEAIKFAQVANAKIIVALTKIDKPDSNPDKVKNQLATDYHLVPEEWGGDVIMVPVSGRTGEGIDKLLDAVLLIADIEEYKADYAVPAKGLVIESRMERGKGAVVGLLIQNGQLKLGSFITAGTSYCKVRTMVNSQGKAITKAMPSTPVTVTGFKGLPEFGDVFSEVKNEKEAKAVVGEAEQLVAANIPSSNVTGLELLNKIHESNVSSDFNVVIKADVQGSLMSIVDSLKMIDSGSEVKLALISSGIGDITENDVKMAANSSTIIYGFNVKVPSAINRLAATLGVKIKIYSVIYELLDDAKEEMEKLLAPEIKESSVGNLIIKGVFKTTKDKIVAGGLVTKGKVYVGLLARASRNKKDLGNLKVLTVEKHQQGVKEVKEGDLCGLSLHSDTKIMLEIGDKIEFYMQEMIARKIK